MKSRMDHRALPSETVAIDPEPSAHRADRTDRLATSSLPPLPVLTLAAGGIRARVRPSAHDPNCASFQVSHTPAPMSASILRDWLNTMTRAGYRRVRTGALHEKTLGAYGAVGFTTAQRLVLLRADFATLELPERRFAKREMSMRRGLDGELSQLATLDRNAFPPTWGMDQEALRDATVATTSFRLRVVESRQGERTHIVGFAISGRSGRSSFLQRLAIDPSIQRRGIGGLLVADSLRWARRWRSHTMTVNTQDSNTAALRLYERSGFIRLNESLHVMERTLDGGLL